MRTNEFIVFADSETSVVNVMLVILVSIVGLLIMLDIIRTKTIKLAFHEINLRLRKAVLPIVCIFGSLNRIPADKIIIGEYPGEDNGIDSSLLDAYIWTKINNAIELRTFLRDMERSQIVRGKKKQIVNQIITDSIGRASVVKLAFIYTDCSFNEKDGISVFKEAKKLIIRVIGAKNFPEDGKNSFFKNVMDNFKSIIGDPELTEDERTFIRADEVRFRITYHDLLKD